MMATETDKLMMLAAKQIADSGEAAAIASELVTILHRVSLLRKDIPLQRLYREAYVLLERLTYDEHY